VLDWFLSPERYNSQRSPSTSYLTASEAVPGAVRRERGLHPAAIAYCNFIAFEEGPVLVSSA
jgi:hypothetical protein